MEYKKTFSCQDNAKKYGIEDIVLTFDKNVDFPYYGLLFAEKIIHTPDGEPEFYEYISYFADDKKKGNFIDTLAYNLLTDKEVITPCTSVEEKYEDGELIKIEKYRLIFFNKESNLFKPTLTYTYNPKEKIDARLLIEYLFVFEKEWIFTLEEIVGVGSQEDFCYPYGPFDNIVGTLDELRELRYGVNHLFFDTPKSTFDSVNEIIELETYNTKGEYKTIKFSKDEWKDIVNGFCSVRLVQIDDGTGWNECVKTDEGIKIFKGRQNRILYY